MNLAALKTQIMSLPRHDVISNVMNTNGMTSLRHFYVHVFSLLPLLELGFILSYSE